MNDDFSDADENDYSFDGENFDSEKLNTGSGETVDKEGWYHLEISDVVPELDTLDTNGNPHTPQIRFDMTVLQTVEKQSPAGHRLYHRIFLATKDGAPPKEGTVAAALRLGIACGLLEHKEKDGREVTVVKSTQNTRIPSQIWKQAKGRQIVAKVKLEKSDNPKYKDKYAIPYGECFDVSDPKVVDVPKNGEALQMIGKVVTPASSTRPAAAPPAAASNGNGAAAAPQQQAAPTGAAPFDDDDLSDL
jgi:hypothetical protein